jgi:hypothetical protein
LKKKKKGVRPSGPALRPKKKQKKKLKNIAQDPRGQGINSLLMEYTPTARCEHQCGLLIFGNLPLSGEREYRKDRGDWGLRY